MVLATCAALHAQPQPTSPPDAAPLADWRSIVREHGLSEQEIELLGQKKVLVSHETFKQVFVPYLGSELPLLITSDSLLNGFHVLFEESVLRAELANARKLGSVLKHLYGNLAAAEQCFIGQPQLLAAAKRRARVLLATAMQLLGETVQVDPDIAPLVREQVALVEAARGTSKPAWLGPPDPGFLALDYTRYQPRGFYTTRPTLQRYFRAVSWLQSIPFRIANDEELTAILLLDRSAEGNRIEPGDRRGELLALLRGYDTLFGSGDDAHLLGWASSQSLHFSAERPFDLAPEAKALAGVRERLTPRGPRAIPRAEINDQLAYVPDDPRSAAELSVRLMPARRIPDGVLFARTTDPRTFPPQGRQPNGLELCAAMGSNFARSRFASQGEAKLIGEIDRCRPFFAGTSLYCDYLRCLEVLVGPPEPDAPPLMSTEAWQVKSCQTVLAGWAQMRHTTALQTKQGASFACASRLPNGFVEPVPEFYARMARMVERAGPLLREAGAFDLDPVGIAEDLRRGVMAEERAAQSKTREGGSQRGVDVEDWRLAQKVDHVKRCLTDDFPFTNWDEYEARKRQQVLELAKQLEQGQMPANPRLARELSALSPEISSRWNTLAVLCRRLETLAHKQLRGAPFSVEENRFIKTYGQTLAQVMFYDGNSYVHPADNAPRVVDVFSNPASAKDRLLEVGVARPRALYVLYPTKNGEIPCRGAVMPYYEFTHDTRLTDADWKALLDSPKRPKSPAWLDPICSPSDPADATPERKE